MKLNHEGEYICECENWEEPVLYPIAELVRCMECKHGSPNGKYGCKLYHFRLYETHEMNADDYCSRAERKEE